MVNKFALVTAIAFVFADGLSCGCALHVNSSYNKFQSYPGIGRAIDDIMQCPFSPLMSFRNRTKELYCCSKFTEYMKVLNHPGFALYLDTMQKWQCPQFKQECETPTFDKYSKYANLVYKMYCNYEAYKTTCHTKIAAAVDESFSANNWTSLIASINTSLLNKEELFEPCVQLALFERKYTKDDFTELNLANIPFCPSRHLVLEDDTIKQMEFSTWDALPTK